MVKRTPCLLAALLLLACQREEVPRTLTFELHGEEVSRIDPGSAIESVDVEVHEPHESKRVVYEAYPLIPVLEQVYGPRWRDEEEILFTCADGYRPSIPVSEFLRDQAYLAFRRSDQERFTVDNVEQGQSDVSLGPFYLVWENLRNRSTRVRESAIWPYQVVGIDLIRFADRFERMLPPRTDENVTAGFVAYRRYCMSCHKINGQGGAKARELNRPNITRVRKPEWLAAFIADPHSKLPGVAMAPLDPHVEDRDRVIRDIVRYLEAMGESDSR